MPPGICRESSEVLAAAYPELEYVEGVRTLIIRTTEGKTLSEPIDHAWNVTRTGEIVDSTLDPELRKAALQRRVELRYEDKGIRPRGQVHDDFADAVRSQVAGSPRRVRRQIIEAMGDWILRNP